MEKKISIKTLYLLFVISIGLIGLGVGSTYALFTASVEISNPIKLATNLSHTSDIIETAQVTVPSNGMVTTTLNITNSTNETLNYMAWYVGQGDNVKVVCENDSSQGTLVSGGSASVVVRVLNNGDETLTVNLGVSSGTDNVVVGTNMIQVEDINVLMSVENRPTASTTSFLSSSLQRGQISSITFVDNIDIPSGNTSVDVSKYTDGSILMWYGTANDSGYYDVYIGSDKGKTYLDNGAYLFLYMSNLTSINFNNFFDTSITESMFGMFGYCSSLVNLDVSNFDTSRVTTLKNMFLAATSLLNLDVSGWNVSNVTNMQQVFGCSESAGEMGLISIGDVSNWDTSKVTTMKNMFQLCTKLESLNVSNWDVSNVTNMSYIFNECSSLQILDVSNWDVSKVTTFTSAFQNCTLVTNLDLSKWNTSSANTMNYMFNGCSSLATIDVSNFDTSSVTDMSVMFQLCSALTSLDLSSFDVSAVTDMSYMFSECSYLNKIYVSDKWKTTSVTTSDYMFENCTSLVGGQGTMFNVNHIDATYARIDGGTSSPGYFISKV